MFHSISVFKTPSNPPRGRFWVEYVSNYLFEDLKIAGCKKLSIVNCQLSIKRAVSLSNRGIIHCLLFIVYLHPNPSASLVPLQRGHLRAYVGSVGYFCVCPVVVVTRPLPFPRGVPATAGEGFKNCQNYSVSKPFRSTPYQKNLRAGVGSAGYFYVLQYRCCYPSSPLPKGSTHASGGRVQKSSKLFSFQTATLNSIPKKISHECWFGWLFLCLHYRYCYPSSPLLKGSTRHAGEGFKNHSINQ